MHVTRSHVVCYAFHANQGSVCVLSESDSVNLCVCVSVDVGVSVGECECGRVGA